MIANCTDHAPNERASVAWIHTGLVLAAPNSKLPVARGRPGLRHPAPEKKMLTHLPIIILTSLHPIAVANDVPKFDIARECRAEGGTTETEKRCADDETQARNELQAKWSQFGPGAKIRCNAETSAGNAVSYVEFLTCLEMQRDANLERGAQTPQ